MLFGPLRTHLHETGGSHTGQVRTTAPGTTVRTYLADLSDLDQVHAMAARIRTTEPRLDALVNNAVAGGGTEPLRRELSHQGHELRFAMNHLGPYALTRDLLPLLIASAPARMVNVASMGQEAIDFDNVMLERDYEALRAHCRSKPAMILATFELATELDGTGVTVNTLHPAHLMDTEGVRAYGLTPAVAVEDGVRPTVRLLLAPALASTTGRRFDRFTDTRGTRPGIRRPCTETPDGLDPHPPRLRRERRASSRQDAAPHRFAAGHRWDVPRVGLTDHGPDRPTDRVRRPTPATACGKMGPCPPHRTRSS